MKKKFLFHVVIALIFLFAVLFLLFVLFKKDSEAQGIWQKPIIYNVAMADADTEYFQAIDRNAEKILIKERSGGSDLKLAYTETESGTNYITIPAGTVKTIDDIFTKDIIFYFQSPDATLTAEIEVWLDR